MTRPSVELPMIRTILLVILIVLGGAAAARAQVAPSGCQLWKADSAETVTRNANHYILLRNIQIDCNDIQLFADEAEVFLDADRVHASGNVTFVSNNNRISADRMDFNTRTKTGTFYMASGIANIENRGIERSLFGSQEPDAYFWGQTIEKLGPKTYKITRGGFTTCVQPTPRWELVSGSATITLEKHAVMTNTLLMVKGVPMFYLPVMYYPINKEDRATGFLMPTYGSSTIRGQTISAPFFWAINRSQDATVEYDFFSKTGQAIGGEYRYIQAPGSQGSVRTQYIAEHEATYLLSDGTQSVVPARTSYSINGSMSQRLPHNLRATANANYFTDIAAQQTYQQSIATATTSTRSFNGGISGLFEKVSWTGSVDRTEYFNGETVGNLSGSFPRVTASRAETKIGSAPLYYGLQGEFLTLQREDRINNIDRTLSRADFTPTLRFPYTRWQFLTFNTVAAMRETYWTESIDQTNPNGPLLDEPVGRRYFSVNTRITGPVFTRIFSSPTHKIKHVIEPTFALQRTTKADPDDVARIARVDSIDSQTSGVTSVTYGVNSRLYFKHDIAREVMTVSVSQTYNSDLQTANLDPQYQTGVNPNLPPTHYSPLHIQGHVTPTPLLDVTTSVDYDTQAHAVRTVATNGLWRTGWVTTTGGWSQSRFIANLPGFNTPTAASNYLNTSTNVKKPGNALGGTYTFNYDLKNKDFLQQRFMLYYNSQCCGVAVEYQAFKFGSAIQSRTGIPQDHRLNISFTLAGIGSFSNLLGAFGGQQMR